MSDKTLHQRLVDQVDAMYDGAERIKNVIEGCNEVPGTAALDTIEENAREIMTAVLRYRGINLNA